MDNLEKNIRLLQTVPDAPGVYLLHDADGTIYYVGKAKSLRKRLASYFKKTPDATKSSFLGGRCHSFEFIVTENELAALILEETLIKKHRPRFNVRMKDDKTYPYIAFTNEDHPRLIYTRNPSRAGGHAFGPYADSGAAKNTAELANNIFKLKRCRRDLPLKRGERPCINRQIGKCSGICTGDITREEYLNLVHQAENFIAGDIGGVIAELNERMKSYAEAFQYEKAASVRNMIFDIQKVAERQNVAGGSVEDRDYIACTASGGEALLLLFEFRTGRLSGRKVFVFGNAEYADTSEIIESFILSHYTDAGALPSSVITETDIPAADALAEHLSGRRGSFTLTRARSRDDEGIIAVMKKNIEVLRTDRESRAVITDAGASLAGLAEALNLPEPPQTLACFDISNFQGKDSVASLSFFRHGLPDRRQYRKFRIRAYDAADDPAMIHEAVSRYLQNAINEGQALPDLIVIDGGPTQLSRALDAARALNAPVRMVSLAKKLEEIYTAPDADPLRIPHAHPSLRLLQRLRDEAHRFGITYHRMVRSKRILSSKLDGIPGIGEKRKKELLKRFGSVAGIAGATREDLTGMGLPLKLAERVLLALGTPEAERKDDLP